MNDKKDKNTVPTESHWNEIVTTLLDAGFTKTELSEHTDITPRTLRRWMNTKDRPPPQAIFSKFLYLYWSFKKGKVAPGEKKLLKKTLKKYKDCL